MNFLVDSIDKNGLILGRNDQIDIPLGTVFTKITKLKVQGDIENLETVELGVVGEINLTLIRISWYKKETSYVPGGHTAGLELKGNGHSLLSEVLRKTSENEYVHIQA